jgi:hypothetical protein
MANSFNISTNAESSYSNGWGAVAILVFLAVAVVLAYMFWPSTSSSCPTTLRRSMDGKYHLESTGQVFDTMNEFEQYWFSSGLNASCPLPVLTGATGEEVRLGRPVTDAWNDWPNEQTYAKTPIYKSDDYEFARVFGFMRDGHLDVPRENYNMILNERTYDWSELPLSSDQRRAKRVEMVEGFSADGELRAEEVAAEALTREAAARFNEKQDHDDDKECKATREEKQVARMVAKAYDNDPSFEPVVKKVGANHWEVVELKPRRRQGEVEEIVPEQVLNPRGPDQVDIQFAYQSEADINAALDPFYYQMGKGPLPATAQQKIDPYYGPVPGMERMMPPTFDHKEWVIPGGYVPDTYQG